MKNHIFISESTIEGHPDKICDRIADSILDEALRQDPASKVTVEATVKDDFVFIYGEANTKVKLECEEIVREVTWETGYTEEYEVLAKVREQFSKVDHAAVQDNGGIDAGDQGVIFGYACDDTDNYIPAAIEYAHKLAEYLNDIRRGNVLLPSDGRTQVSVEYESDKIKRINTIVTSTRYVAEASQQQIADIVTKDVITLVIPDELLDEGTIYLINSSGGFVMGGSSGDSGITGRGIVVDSYGGMGKIGGDCFPSEDPSKVDHSAAYYCRYVAKNTVTHQLASKYEVQVVYAISKVKPVSIMIDSSGTGNKSDEEVPDIIRSDLSFEVKDITEELKFCYPIYKTASCYGRSGREEFNWEKIKDLKH